MKFFNLVPWKKKAKITAVIGEYADYYCEHDGMIEVGPGCYERLKARIDALPDGDPRKIELI